ncbi:Restriction endonuclease [Bosea lupini]|uniref:Restriction endonuclease n=1 Tax=Bosea lupini TaxID=1036779 RepID=A0A1H7WCW6_9HYPH|nr:restriction endonuclease [Bosea lupini]SEM19442.1 Restriction endonuclease [Bosea lupini]
MAQLRPVELKFVDELFRMSSGYVLDFTNSTFADFFHQEVGIDIYDNAYAINGESKGKHLRAFLTIGQPRAIAKALAALWEYREADRLGRGQTETVVNAQRRLSAIVERLGGPALPSYAPVAPAAAETTSQAALRPFRADEATLRRLDEGFLALHEMSDEPQARGRHFESLLTDLFNAWGMDARGGFHVIGEQIDGSFQHGNDTYLLEAKWHRAKTDATTLHGFQGKVNERPEWTRGLFVSFSGFTEVGLQAFTARKIILADGMDIYDALARRLSVSDIIAAKVRHASEYRNPFERVRSLFPL